VGSNPTPSAKLKESVNLMFAGSFLLLTSIGGEKMKIMVLGAGALGSTFGGTLAEAGFDVCLINRNAAYFDAVKNRGLIFADDPDTVVPIHVYQNTQGLGIADLVIVLVKSTNTREVLENSLNIIGEKTVVMSLQNGLGNEDMIAEIIGREKVVSGRTYVGGGMLKPGYVKRSVKGKMTYIGELDGSKSERILNIAEAFNRAGLETEVSDNIQGLIWDKLLINAATGALTAITRLSYGPIFSDESIPEMKETGLNVIREGIAVAKKKQIVLSCDDPETIWYKAAENLPYEFKTSMLQSIEKNATTEIDFINGAIVREGAKTGVDTPVNKTLVACMKGIELRMKKS
jgi:2-dehydropantoate 2-reductase